MLGLSLNDRPTIKRSRVTTLDTLPDVEIVRVIGIAEGIAERGFRSVEIEGFGITQGGGLSDLLSTASQAMLEQAVFMGADAVVGVRYQTASRPLEKSVIAYGTAVSCRDKP